MAQVTGNSNLISLIGTPKLSGFDLRSHGVFYHLGCYVNLCNDYNKMTSNQEEENVVQRDTTKMVEAFAVNNVVSYIKHQSSLYRQIPLKLQDLETRYKGLLDSFWVQYDYHATRFLARLREEIPQLNDMKISKNLYVTLASQFTNKMLHNFDSKDGLKVISSAAKYLRSVLKTVSNDFNGPFQSFTPQETVPTELLIFCSLILEEQKLY